MQSMTPKITECKFDLVLLDKAFVAGWGGDSICSIKCLLCKGAQATPQRSISLRDRACPKECATFLRFSLTIFPISTNPTHTLYLLFFVFFLFYILVLALFPHLNCPFQLFLK